MSVYSIDLRGKLMAAVGRGASAAEAVRRFGVDPTTARRWRRRAEAGEPLPRRVGARRVPTKLTAADLALLASEVDARPGVTLRELAARLGARVAESTVCRALRRLGYRHEKSRWRPASS